MKNIFWTLDQLMVFFWNMLCLKEILIDKTMSEVYAKYKDEDGFLYLEYKGAEWTG